MIIERSMSPDWLSNSWLVADGPGGRAVLIDTGGPPEPILAKVRDLRLEVTHALCTHHHVDHVAHNGLYRRELGCLIAGHELESALFGGLDVALRGGEELRVGGLAIRALHIPGHTIGQMAWVVNEACVFTGDTLFRSSVGGTCAPGHGTFDQIRRSIMEVLMKLPAGMDVLPGHTDATTIGREWDQNPFIRAWRGLDRPAATPCVAAGRPATLLLRARDYDGGTKCWVRLDQDGREEIMPGSVVRDDPGR